METGDVGDAAFRCYSILTTENNSDAGSLIEIERQSEAGKLIASRRKDMESNSILIESITRVTSGENSLNNKIRALKRVLKSSLVFIYRLRSASATFPDNSAISLFSF